MAATEAVGAYFFYILLDNSNTNWIFFVLLHYVSLPVGPPQSPSPREPARPLKKNNNSSLFSNANDVCSLLL